MRFLPKITEILDSGYYLGASRAQTRVTVEPYWQLKSTAPGVGTNGSRGPYRYYQLADNSQFEVEVPNIKNVDIDRDLGQEVASCNIAMYNHWHQGNTVPSQLAGQLGEPGRFWFDRGTNATANETWNQEEAIGATAADGTDLPTFSWKNVLVPHALLRTYQGYGGFESDGVTPLSVADAVLAGNLVITGVWLIDSIRGGTDGMLNFTCRDIGRVLRDQMVYPPVVPSTLYPLEYVPPGQSNFDSLWGPQPRRGDAGEHGKLRLSFASGSTMEAGYEGSKSVDGKYNTYSLSTADDDADTSIHSWEYTVSGNSIVNGLTIYPYGGGYTMYVSIQEDGEWIGTEVVPGTSTVYARSYGLRVAEVGSEKPLSFVLPTNDDAGANFGGYRGTAAHPLRIKLTFTHNRYLAGPGGAGYRAGIRDLVLTSMSTPVDLATMADYSAPIICEAIGRHPTRGYFIADQEGNTYGFGDGAGYDTESGLYPVGGVGADNVTQSIPAGDIKGIATLKDGRSYWTVEAIGRVHAYGDAVHYGELTVALSTHGMFNSGPEGVGFDPYNPQSFELRAMDIAAAHDDQGYWVLYSNGHVRGFGSAANTPGMYSADGGQAWGLDDVMTTSVVQFMEAATADWTYPFIQLRGTAIVGHPTRMGFWVMNGCGEVWAVGDDIPYFGGLVNRVYDNGLGVSWRLGNAEYARGIECSWDGGGYWISAGSGLVGQFGNTVGVGVTNFYGEIYGITQDPPSDPFHEVTPEELIALAPSLIGDIVRSPDGKGFYVLGWGGWVGAVNSDVWGNPGYWGNSGFLWNEGNFPSPPGRDADYVDIVKELLMWGGFYLYDPANAATQGTDPEDFPALFGATESTGIASTAKITLDKFDKKSLLDCINMLKEIVAYNFFIDEEGGARFESPNWWRSGNYVMNGKPANSGWDGASAPVEILWETAGFVVGTIQGYRIYRNYVRIAEVGPDDRSYIDTGATAGAVYNVQAFTEIGEFGDSFGSSSTVGGTPALTPGEHTDYIPVLHEAVNLIGYSAVADGASTLTEIVVGSQEPRFNDFSTTQTTRYVPPSAVANLYEDYIEDVPFARGINRPAWMMNSEIKEGDRLLMAELISLQLWFSQRAGQVNTLANPCIQLNDQVQIIERNTSEIYTHYVRGIKSSMDCDSGVWTMSLSTNWLGTPGDWVITKDNVTDPFTHVQATSSVTAWLKNHVFDVESLEGSGTTERSTAIEGILSGESSERLNWSLSTSSAYGSVGATPVGWVFTGTIFQAYPAVAGLTLTSQNISSFIGTPQIRFFTEAGSPTWSDWVDLPAMGTSQLLSELGNVPDDADVPFEIRGYATAHGSGNIRLVLSGTGVDSDTISGIVLVTT